LPIALKNATENWNLRLETQDSKTWNFGLLDSETLRLWDFETWEFEKIQIQIWPEWISISVNFSLGNFRWTSNFKLQDSDSDSNSIV
jgi:hypothetical protein